MRSLVLALTLVLLSSQPAPSQDVTYRVYDMVRIHRTDLHRAIYRMMEDCTHKNGDVDAVEWYAAKALVRQPDGQLLKGLWSGRGDNPRIILDGAYMWDGTVISHEVLHDLYQGQPGMDVAHRCALRGWTFTRDRRER